MTLRLLAQMQSLRANSREQDRQSGPRRDFTMRMERPSGRLKRRTNPSQSRPVEVHNRQRSLIPRSTRLARELQSCGRASPRPGGGAHCRLCSRQRDTVVCGPMLRVLRLSKLQPAKAEEWQKRQELRRPLSVVARERSTGKNGDTRAGGKEQSYLHAAMTDHAQ